MSRLDDDNDVDEDDESNQEGVEVENTDIVYVYIVWNYERNFQLFSVSVLWKQFPVIYYVFPYLTRI